jgi:metal-responsive CopG/Arc/MetJ family transcriptional regulator
MAQRQAKATKAPELRGLAFKLPGDLLADLDAIARAEGRSRTKQIEAALRQFVQDYQRRARGAA